MIDFLIIFFGFLIRIYLILERNIFTDEVFYTEVALKNNIKDIIFINHWIKDHGVLYYIFLKIFLFFTKKVEIIRFSNIFLYILLSIFVIYTFNKIFKKKYLTTAFLFIYSFNHYFVYLNSWVSPFNLVSFFSIISILSLMYILFKNNLNKEFCSYYFLFISSTILAFYSDYSFFYLIIFYFLTSVYYIFKLIKNKEIEKIYIFLNSCLLILIFITPGIFQFYYNFDKIKYLFGNLNYEYKNFFALINHLNQIFFFRKDNLFSLSFFVLLIFFNIKIIFKNKKDRLIITTIKIILLSILGKILTIFIVSKNFFNLVNERSFWPIYLFFILNTTFNSYALFKSKIIFNKIVGKILLIILLFGLFTKSNLYYIPANIKEEMPYKNFINNQKNTDVIILVDKLYYYYPITNYYYSEVFGNKINKPNLFIIRNQYLTEVVNKINSIFIFYPQRKNFAIVFLNYHLPNIDIFYSNLKNKFPDKNIKIYNLFSEDKNLFNFF